MKTRTRTDQHLQVARRLDWRFLLPEPQLRRVAYFGPADTALAQALALFSEAFTPFSTAEAAARATEKFDLGVAIAPTLAQLQIVEQVLRPSGCLYIEIRSAWESLEDRKRPSWPQSFVGISSYLAQVRRLGFAEVAAYWHRPSFEKSLQIIPLHDERVMEFIDSQRASDLLSQIKFATGKSLLKTRWLLRLFQSISIVASR